MHYQKIFFDNYALQSRSVKGQVRTVWPSASFLEDSFSFPKPVKLETISAILLRNTHPLFILFSGSKTTIFFLIQSSSNCGFTQIPFYKSIEVLKYSKALSVSTLRKVTFYHVTYRDQTFFHPFAVTIIRISQKLKMLLEVHKIRRHRNSINV